MLAAIGGFFTAIFGPTIYQPLYNALVYLVGIIPGHDVGIAVILLTIIVRIILWPLARRAVKAQLAMKELAPEVDKIKAKYKNKKDEESKAIFALYRERDVHPFASVGLLLIQLPILISLYWVFSRGGLPAIHTNMLYSFVAVPSVVNMEFLGIVNMGSHSIVLACLAAITQFGYTRLSMGPRQKTPESSPVEASLSGDMAKSFDLQARYAMPILIGVVAYSVVAAAPLYYTTSNLFMIAQEYLAGRRFKG